MKAGKPSILRLHTNTIVQSKIQSDDTIAAIATPPGEGAISIVRISGPGAIGVGDEIFHGRAPLSAAGGYTVHYGFINDDTGRELDEVLVTVFKAPHSYTGEDSLEIGCHGGFFTSKGILELVLKHGARQADPGEFTKRAFLNGKLDLTQAEAVADLISSSSVRAQQQSLGQLQGSLKKKIDAIKSELLEILYSLEIELDFSEEGISFVSTTEIQNRLNNCLSGVKRLLESYETGRIIRHGVRVVLAGPPNAGKSSIFNALLSNDRSIVSEIPGTTRDYIEESILISGIRFLLVDTAGGRESADFVEKEGVSRSRNLLKTSDLTIAVVDGTSRPDTEFWRQWMEGSIPSRVIVAFNKSDLRKDVVRPEGFPEGMGTEIHLSARTGYGLEELRELMRSSVANFGQIGEFDVVVTNKRHAESLLRVQNAIETSLSSSVREMTNEFIALDVRLAIEAIGGITGEITTEDVLNGIFERFCVGK